MEHQRPESREQFRVAIVCALSLEFNAVLSILDQTWDNDGGPDLGKSHGDLNEYVNGRIGQHNVVLTLLPNRMGKVNAAVVASDLRHSYPNLRLTLLVGICGGVPMAGRDEVILGDVVISRSLVQYDFGREYPDGFRRKNSSNDNLAGPNHEILGILAMLSTDRKELLCQRTVSVLRNLQERKPKYAFPQGAPDRLFQSSYRHKHQGSPACECLNHTSDLDPVCEEAMERSCDEVGCEDSFLVRRNRVDQRTDPEPPDGAFNPAIHVGPVGSGDTVMKSGIRRDKIAQREGIIAFEMEAAGIWEHLSCLVVKGVCDYADSHKNKKWQDYAAATAAAAAKALLTLYTPPETTVLVHRRSFTPKWAVPFPPDPDFVDQPEISAWLQEKSRLPGARVALVGLGGIGKSQLAIQHAHRVRKQSHVFWLNATTRNTLVESYRAIARRLGLGGPEDSQEETHRRVSNWLGDEENGRWTVVLDNFDDCSILGEDDPRFSKLLPQTSNGFTLITSRTSQAAEKLVGNSKNIHPVTPMSEEIALRLFQTKLQDGCEEEEGREVVRILDCMPLAISQAAAYINRRRPQVSVQEYASMLRREDKQGVLLSYEYSDDRRYGGASTTVLGTWMFTFEQIQKERPSAAELLSLMSFFNPQSIPDQPLKEWYHPNLGNLLAIRVRDTSSQYKSALLSSVGKLGRMKMYDAVPADEAVQIWSRWVRFDLARRGKPVQAEEKPTAGRWMPRFSLSKDRRSSKTGGRGDGNNEKSSWDSTCDGEQFEKDLDTLIGYSLVIPTASKGVFKMHPLVRYCTQTWLSQHQFFETWKRRFMLVAALWNHSTKGHDRPLLLLANHFNPLTEDEPQDVLTARVWVDIGEAIYHPWIHMGALDLLTSLLDKLIAVATKFFGEVDPTTVMVMGRRANLHKLKGEYDKAEAIWKDISQRAEKYFGDHHDYEVQEARLEYSSMLLNLGRASEAEEIIRDVVDFRLEACGLTWDKTLDVLAQHAQVLADLGRFQEACSIIRDLLTKDWTGKSQLVYESIMNKVAGTAYSMGMSSAEEVEGLLREMVGFIERNPSICVWFRLFLGSPFHQALYVYLLKQWQGMKVDTDGDRRLAEARSTYIRGMDLLSRYIPMPTLRPPTLLDSLLHGKEEDDDDANKSQLLQDVIDNMDRDDVKLDATFYWGMSNIGRRLHMQGRHKEVHKLLDAVVAHITNNPAYGEGHLLAREMRDLRKEMKNTNDFLAQWVKDTAGEGGEPLRDKGQSISAESAAETLVDSETA